MRALIGHTGFVGGALARKYTFDRYYNSQNIHTLSGAFSSIHVAGMPGTKWKANQQPDDDGKALDEIIAALSRVNRTCAIVLYSTVDVFAITDGATPDRPTDATQPYGLHRKLLEDYVQVHFSHYFIRRLPSLFGLGLKKNALYDLIRGDRLEHIHPCDSFQWLDVDEADVGDAGLKIQHFCPEPIKMSEIAWAAFGISRLPCVPDREPVQYDMRATYGGYTETKQSSLRKIIKFVHETRRQ